MGDPTAGLVLNYKLCLVPKLLCYLPLRIASGCTEEQRVWLLLFYKIQISWNHLATQFESCFLRKKIYCFLKIYIYIFKINAAFITYKYTLCTVPCSTLLVIALLMSSLIHPWLIQIGLAAVTLKTSILSFRFCFISGN